MIWFVVFLLLGLGSLVIYATSVLNHNLCVIGDFIDAINGRFDAANKNIGLLGELTDAATRAVLGRLDRGVKPDAGSQFRLIHPYEMHLLFDDGDEAAKVMCFEDAIGIDDEIELLEEEDDKPGLSVTFDDCCLVRHPLEGFVELSIPIDEPLSLFRDRLIGDGWEITSPEDDDGVDDDAETTPDEADRVCAGT